MIIIETEVKISVCLRFIKVNPAIRLDYKYFI